MLVKKPVNTVVGVTSSNMKLHPTSISSKSGELLGVEIMRLRYDEVLRIIQGMKEEVERQYVGDGKRGYHKLSRELNELYWTIAKVEMHIQTVCDICRPYLQAEVDAAQRDSSTRT